MPTAAQGPLPALLQLTNPEAVDQDDMCFWTHPTDASQSLVIVSDKSAGSIFVYDASGELLQSVPVPQPGNIDLRLGFRLGDQPVSLIAVNERQSQTLLLFRWDEGERRLIRVDDGRIATGENYGGTLLHLAGVNRWFFVVTSKENGVKQYELMDNGQGRVAGRELRCWPLPMCEGAVADDQAGKIYVSVEAEGVFQLPGDPADATEPLRVISKSDEQDFVGDVEGITLLRTEPDAAFLLLSDQGASQFRLYQISEGRTFPLRAIFAVERTQHTDGVDITLSPFGARFPHGVLACHSDVDDGRTVQLADAAAVLDLLRDRAPAPHPHDPRSSQSHISTER
jgi:3-phytase